MTGDDVDTIWTTSGRRALSLQVEAFTSRAILIIRRGRAIVDAGRPDKASLRVARRLELCRILHEYQRFKHGAIFDPIVQRGGSDHKKAAQLLKCECLYMGEAFATYCARWAYVDGSNWAEYTREMLGTTNTLIHHLEVEQLAIQHLLSLVADEESSSTATARAA